MAVIQKRIPRRRVDGVLLLDKPQGMTSNAALQTARRLLNAAKAGHTGTLDPMATGLLPLTFGEATKFSQMLLDADKTYEATLQLGIVTDTGDADGRVLEVLAVEVDEAQILAALQAFVGDIEQLPPMYSALKRDGKPLYEYARAGIEVERAPRPVRIHSIEPIAVRLEDASVTFRVSCSKGTYVRTLAMDIGERLGCGAHLTALRRTRIGAFDMSAVVSLAELEAASGDARDGLLAPVDALIAAFPVLALDGEQAAAVLQGRSLRLDNGQRGSCRLYEGARFLGLGEVDEEGRLLPKRLIATVSDH